MARRRRAEDYTVTSQLMTYEGERAMFEAYRRNQYVSTGVIQWMFNNAWPSIYWHLFDWYLLPGGGYFGAKKANEPVHVLYSYDDRTIAVVNSNQSRAPIRGAHLRARILGLDGIREIREGHRARHARGQQSCASLPCPSRLDSRAVPRISSICA